MSDDQVMKNVKEKNPSISFTFEKPNNLRSWLIPTILIGLVLAILPLYFVFISWVRIQAASMELAASREEEIGRAETRKATAEHLAETLIVVKKSGMTIDQYIEFYRIKTYETTKPKMVITDGTSTNVCHP